MFPSIRNCTPATAALSEAVALTVIMVDTCDPETGELTLTVGGVVSVGSEGIDVGIGVAVGVGEAVAIGVGVTVGVREAVAVGMDVDVAVGVGVAMATTVS